MRGGGVISPAPKVHTRKFQDPSFQTEGFLLYHLAYITASSREVQETTLFISIKTSNMKRALLIGLLFFGMNAQANPRKDTTLELKKKAVYYNVKAQLESGEITLQEAQRLWKKQLKRIYKEEGK